MIEKHSKHKDVRYKNATCPEGKKAIKVYDGGGLYLLVSQDGKKYWRLNYRIHGKEKLISLGAYPSISLSEAREKAKLERTKLESNIDPSIARKLNKQKAKEAAANSFEATA